MLRPAQALVTIDEVANEPTFGRVRCSYVHYHTDLLHALRAAGRYLAAVADVAGPDSGPRTFAHYHAPRLPDTPARLLPAHKTDIGREVR